MKSKLKDRFKLVIIFIILIFLVFVLCKYYKKSHSIIYSINGFNINEKYEYNNKNHLYNIVISKDKNNFIYSNNNNFSKDKKIIKDIIFVKKKNIYCISPIYKDDSNGNILCKYNDNIITSYYLEIINNDLYKSVVKQFKKKNININKNYNSFTKYKKISIYKDNLLDNDNYIVWDYKGIYMISNKFKYKRLLNEDKYDNELAITLNNYYIYIDTNNKYKGFKLYVYDMNKDKLDYFEDKNVDIDDDIVFCGTYNNLLYIFDRHNKIQYTFNPKKNELNKVGYKDIGFYIVKNNHIEFVDYSLFKNNIIFNSYVDNQEISDLYNAKYIYLINNNYYVYSKDGYFYMIDYNDIKNSTILFKFDNINYFIFRNNNIIFSVGDTIYRYNDEYGYDKIISSNELKYNYNNIFDYR